MKKGFKATLLALLAVFALSCAAFAADTSLVLSLDAGQELEGYYSTTPAIVSFDITVSVDAAGTLTPDGTTVKTGADKHFTVKIDRSGEISLLDGTTTVELAAAAAAGKAVLALADGKTTNTKQFTVNWVKTGTTETTNATAQKAMVFDIEGGVDYVSFDITVSVDAAGTLTPDGTTVKTGADKHFTVKIDRSGEISLLDGTTTVELAAAAAAGKAVLALADGKTTNTKQFTVNWVKTGTTETTNATAQKAMVADIEAYTTKNIFTVATPQTIEGTYTGNVFTVKDSFRLAASDDEDGDAFIGLGGLSFKLTSDETKPTSFSITSTDLKATVYTTAAATSGTVYSFDVAALTGSADVSTTAAFDKASFDVYAAGKKVATVTFTSKDAEESVTVSTDVTVSFDLKKFDVLKVASGDTEIVSKDGVYSLDIAKVAKIVTIKFASGDNGGSFDVKLTINVDTAASKEYVLNLKGTTFKFTGSNGQSASFDAKTSTYSASSALASVDASGAWGTMSFTVSSDVFSDFVISVDFPASASVAAVYYREGTTGSYVADTDAYKAKVLSPYEGYYKFVFSADLIASSDSSASGKSGYFGFTIQVASVDSGSSSTLVEESAASVEPVTRSDGNMEIPAGKTIKTKFLSSNGTLTAAIVSAFFNSNNATSVEMATPEEITAALSKLGFTASDLGDAENGYKIVGLALPSNVTLSEGMKFFVMITTAKDGSGKSALGMGVLSKKQLGLGFLPIVFKLLKNPANTNNYMTFEADEYFVGATNDMGESSSSTSARVVFVTADGDTFTIAADDTTLLQGQNASGDATPYTGDDDDDDDNQETSSHGSSSGCDAGFGALALLAVAGALAARKVRK